MVLASNNSIPGKLFYTMEVSNKKAFVDDFEQVILLVAKIVLSC